MKRLKINLKFALFSVLTTGLLTITRAQTPVRPDLANTDDKEIYNDSEAVLRNTGMGSIEDKQVMVYDLANGTAQIGWDYAGTQSKTELNGGEYAYDPDVVMANYDGADYALAVFINGNNKVQWESYKWVSGTFQLQLSCELGHLSYCGSPNVDVNSAGMVAITWHESYEVLESWDLKFTNPAITPTELNPLTGTMEFVVSDVYGAYGYIDGSGPAGDNLGCTCSSKGAAIGISGINNCKGDLVSPSVGRPINAEGDGELYVFNQYPDVAISGYADYNTVVTFTYVNGQYRVDAIDATIHTETGTVYQPHTWYNGTYSAFLETPLDGKPRIASRQVGDMPNDFEIVTALSSCNNSVIYNWGVFNGTERPDYTVVNTEFTERPNADPVVTYNGGNDGDDGIYTIAWASHVAFCLDEDNGWDILARSYINGSHFPAGIPVYSYVNKGTFHGDDLEGDQIYPSVAARLTNDGVDYMFYEDYYGNHSVLYKHSDILAGSGHVRIAPDPNNDTKTEDAIGHFGTEENFNSYPNPFTDKVNFTFTLKEGEKGDRIMVTDVKGTQIKSFDLSSYRKGAHTLEWEPGKVPAGIYIVRYSTSEGTKTLEITTTE